MWGVACIYEEGKHQWWLSLETIYHIMSFFLFLFFWFKVVCQTALEYLWLCPSMCQQGVMNIAVYEAGQYCTLLAPNLMLLTCWHYFIALVWQQLQPSDYFLTPANLSLIMNNYHYNDSPVLLNTCFLQNPVGFIDFLINHHSIPIENLKEESVFSF